MNILGIRNKNCLILKIYNLFFVSNSTGALACTFVPFCPCVSSYATSIVHLWWISCHRPCFGISSRPGDSSYVSLNTHSEWMNLSAQTLHWYFDDRWNYFCWKSLVAYFVQMLLLSRVNGVMNSEFAIGHTSSVTNHALKFSTALFRHMST